MDTLKLYVENLETGNKKNGSIWGIIYFRFNGFSFPDNVWFDAVSSILCMWSDVLYDFILTKQSQCVLSFMDGDYEVLITKTNTKSVIARCVKNDYTVAERSISLISLIQNIHAGMISVKKHHINSKSTIKRLKVYCRILSKIKKLERLIEMGDSLTIKSQNPN